MRVLHILCDLGGGGAERMVVELCRRRGPGIDVEVATVQGGGVLEAELAGIPVTIGGRPRKHLGLRALTRLVPAVRRADIVHTHLFAGDTWGRVAAVLANHPRVVTTEHNVDRDEGRLLRHALGWKTNVAVAVSEAVARHVTWTRDIRVIENGVDLDRFTAPHVGGGGVLAVGRCVPQKGFDVLAAALPPGMRARIAGEGPVETPGIERLGWTRDVAPLYAEADVVVIPSRWEGFGLVAVEAMAAGVPVIASAVDGLVDVVGDAGILVPPEDVEALRDALLRVRDDSQLRAELAARGRIRARRWDITRCVRAYERLYTELSG